MIARASAWLLDLDGTLTDNYPGISRSILFALDRLGAPIPDDAALRRCVGPPLRESFRWLLDTDDPEAIEQAIGVGDAPKRWKVFSHIAVSGTRTLKPFISAGVFTTRFEVS